MRSAGQLFEDAINQWRDNKGVGTALIPHPLDNRIMILGILQRVYARDPTCNTIIIVNDFNERGDLLDYLTHQEEEENNKEFTELIDKKIIKVFTSNYIISRSNTPPKLCILYKPKTLVPAVAYMLSLSKWRLTVMTKLFEDTTDTAVLYKMCPILSEFKVNEINEIRTNTPVEEVQIPITITEDSEEYKLLNYYNEYITHTINIFGSFNIIEQARIGNQSLNISANQICAQIAQENGWNENLDMSVEYNRQIDELYNPNNLKERASLTYDIIRKRSALLTDYESKLESIVDIIEQHPDKKILIINKRGEFASKVTDFINKSNNTLSCGNYHNNLENVPAVDDDGNYIYYKSGAKKGEVKMLGMQAQKTLNQRLFNEDKIQILSTNGAPDKSLSIDVDIIIITSPLCESIKSYIYRLSDLRFNSDKIKLYTLYCKDTIEEKQLMNKEVSSNHIIINKCENIVISNEISDFVIVD